MKAQFKKLFVSVAAIIVVGFASMLIAPSSQAGGLYFGFSQGYYHHGPFIRGGGYYDGGYPYDGPVIVESNPWRWEGTRVINDGCRVVQLRRYCRTDEYGYGQCYVQRVEGWRC